ncbi:MAG: hypothetical protein K8S54_09615 [Spirochaetia bacterium]|nr:hypothetical protein [Spirochaetia bacterium]
MEGSHQIEQAHVQPVNPFHRQPPVQPSPTLFTRAEMAQFLDRMNPVRVPGEDKGQAIDTQA